jgi:hypothetical protein
MVRDKFDMFPSPASLETTSFRKSSKEQSVFCDAYKLKDAAALEYMHTVNQGFLISCLVLVYVSLCKCPQSIKAKDIYFDYM